MLSQNAIRKDNDAAPLGRPTLGEAMHEIGSLWLNKYEISMFTARLVDAQDGAARKKILREARRKVETDAKNAAELCEMAAG